MNSHPVAIPDTLPADITHARREAAAERHSSALDACAEEITESLLKGRPLMGYGWGSEYSIDNAELVENIDMAKLIAAYQHGLVGSHANAVRLMSEVLVEAAVKAGETYADKRHAYLVREGR
jgi:hypothetical protein